MPLYKSVTIAPGMQLLIWKITESIDELATGVRLRDACVLKMEKMYSEQHRKALLAVRRLMQEVGYSDLDLYYGPDGKPHLTDGTNISITHSYSFAAIIIGRRNSGIDMEMQREKVVTIADKFVDLEFAFLDPTPMEEYMRKLIVIWGVKEAIYKMVSRKGLSFKQHINVHPFEITDWEGTAAVKFEELDETYPFRFDEIEGFTMVYCLEELL